MPPPIQLQRLPSKKKPALKRALLFLALVLWLGISSISVAAAAVMVFNL
ncbi:MAG: hypothetical protein LBV14_11410 [Acidovorax sp.]|nr:hypothetical protein [Acidovorax sp.]